MIVVANKINGLYLMTSSTNENKILLKNIFVKTTKLTEKERWNQILGYVNFKYLEKLWKTNCLSVYPKV